MNILILKGIAEEIVAMLDTQDEITTEVEELFHQLEQKGAAAIAPLCDVFDELSIRAAARKEKAKLYAELAKKDEIMAANAKKYLVAIMQATGQKKMSIGALTITLSDGKESVEITDEAAVPMKYMVATVKISGDQIETLKTVFGDSIKSIKTEPDKTAIKAATDENIGIGGTQIVRNPYVIIKG